jgi:hypothetical protein
MQRKIDKATLAFWMIVLGMLATWAGASDIHKRWVALASGARVCDALILASGILLLTAGAWQALSRGRQRASAAIGAVASGAFTATLLLGVWTGAIPCSGPG